jgi:hypothetical protein
MQVDPVKPALKPTGTKRLKLNYDLLSTSAFKCNFRRFTLVIFHNVFLVALSVYMCGGCILEVVPTSS